MNCDFCEKLIPSFIKGEMDNRTAMQFLEHVHSCSTCKEELSIQFLVTTGMERLENGDVFNLNKELNARIELAHRHVNIRRNLQWGLYYFEAITILITFLVMTMVVFE